MTLFSLDREAVLVRQIEANIKKLIMSRALPPGYRLPSIRRMARDCSVSTYTVVTAYDRLVATNFIRASPGAGYFVVEKQLDADAETKGSRATEANDAQTSAADSALAIHAFAGSRIFPSGWLQLEQMQRCARHALRSSRWPDESAADPQGLPALRRIFALKLIDQGIAAQPDQILTTTGVIHGLDLLLRLHTAPGDHIAIDQPCHPALIMLLRRHRLRPLAVARTEDGPDPAMLQLLLKTHHPKLFITSSLLQDPTGSSLTPAIAHRLLGLVEQHDVLVAEIDMFGDLQAGSTIRLANLDQLNRVVSLTGFTGIIGDGLQIGFVAGHPAIIARMRDLKTVVSPGGNDLAERAMEEFLSSGHYRRLTERLRQRLLPRTEALVGTLERRGWMHIPTPPAAIFLWVHLPEEADGTALCKNALQQDIFLTPGNVFFMEPPPDTWVRLNVSQWIIPDELS